MAFEHSRLKVVMESWASVQGGAKVVFLASEVARGKTIYPDDMMIYSDTMGDDSYPSHVAKGMMGLVRMAERFPKAKVKKLHGSSAFVIIKLSTI